MLDWEISRENVRIALLFNRTLGGVASNQKPTKNKNARANQLSYKSTRAAAITYCTYLE